MILSAFEPAQALKDISKASVALATTTGIIPVGNSDHLPSSGATTYYTYTYSDTDTYETASGGYDPTQANANANVQIPFDLMVDKEMNGEISSFDKTFYTTTGYNMTTTTAVAVGNSIGNVIVASGVDAIILTADVESSTYAAAIIANKIEEKAGIPVVLITALPEVAQNLGVNRIVTGVNPAYVLGKDTSMQIKAINAALEALVTEVESSTVFDIYGDYSLEFSAPSTFSLSVASPGWDGTMAQQMKMW